MTRQTPETCRHYAGKKKCAPGWFHGKCCLCYKCIKCPQYQTKEQPAGPTSAT